MLMLGLQEAAQQVKMLVRTRIDSTGSHKNEEGMSTVLNLMT
jgi:hypothetical protein